MSDGELSPYPPEARKATEGAAPEPPAPGSRRKLAGPTSLFLAAPLVTLVLVVLALLLLFAVTGKPPFRGLPWSPPAQVKIFLSVPLSSPVFGASLRETAELALRDAGGRAGDLRVQLVVRSSSSGNTPLSIDRELESARAAIADPEIVAYVGSPSTFLTRVALAPLNEAGIVQVSPTASWPGLTKPGFGPGEPGIYYPTGRRHFFRLIPSDEVLSQAAAKWARRQGASTAFIFHDDTTYGRGISGMFESSAEDLGLTIVGRALLPFTADPGSDEQAVTDALATMPGLVYFCGGVPGAYSRIGALRELAPDQLVLITDGFPLRELVSRLGAERVEGIHTIVPALSSGPPSPELGVFRKRFREAYGRDPSPEDARTYDAIGALLQAIARADEPTRLGVLEALRGLGEYSGVLGRWSFDENGDISLRGTDTLQLRGGQWREAQ